MSIGWYIGIGFGIAWLAPPVIILTLGLLFEVRGRRADNRQLPDKRLPQHISPPEPLENHVRRIPITTSTWETLADAMDEQEWFDTLEEIQTLPEAKRP